MASNDAELMKLSGQLLSRMGSDPKFAEHYDRDPAGALQDVFPDLKKVPKEKITSELDSAHKSLVALAQAAQGKEVAVLGGIISALTKVAQTSAVRSVAQAVVTAAASAVVSHFLKGVAAEPAPE